MYVVATCRPGSIWNDRVRYHTGAVLALCLEVSCTNSILLKYVLTIGNLPEFGLSLPDIVKNCCLCFVVLCFLSGSWWMLMQWVISSCPYLIFILKKAVVWTDKECSFSTLLTYLKELPNILLAPIHFSSLFYLISLKRNGHCYMDLKCYWGCCF